MLKRRNNRQNATFYMEARSVDECVSNAKRDGAKVVVDRHEISEGFCALLKDPQDNVIWIWEERAWSFLNCVSIV